MYDRNSCSLCRGEGFIITLDQKCTRCKGSGDESTMNTPMARLWGEIDRLHADSNEFTTATARQYARGEPPRKDVHARCLACRGNGFTTRTPTLHAIDKCRTCNGTGTIGKALPVIERLWYEIDRLHREARKREEDFSRRGERPWREPPRETVTVADRDIWIHILGLNGDITVEAVKKAYKQKATQYHPDSGGSDRDFRMVKLAYDNLMQEL